MSTGGPADLAQQVERTLRELTQTFDDIGVPNSEKEQRTKNVYKALQDCLREQVNATNRYGSYNVYPDYTALGDDPLIICSCSERIPNSGETGKRKNWLRSVQPLSSPSDRCSDPLIMMRMTKAYV